MEQGFKNKKCQCGQNNKITCPNCSEVKMVILLKNGFNYLKYPSKSGRLVNPVWYNHISKNRKNINALIEGMQRRFLHSEYAGKANKINFYSNTTGQLLKSITV
ncbi:hypothetical protein [Tenacibaculum sp. 190130A14a]|uniref:Uncharacterized protein n=1 Tax=Tenacibaculum polynesiense TaxID=3137857 RepID=A0ABM9PGA9_9FLAO